MKITTNSHGCVGFTTTGDMLTPISLTFLYCYNITLVMKQLENGRFEREPKHEESGNSRDACELLVCGGGDGTRGLTPIRPALRTSSAYNTKEIRHPGSCASVLVAPVSRDL